MCLYYDILGTGSVLNVQLITLLAIAASIVFWVWAYVRAKVPLEGYAFPIVLWVVFGSLDIMLTVRGALYDPMVESNPLTRFLLLGFGASGAPLAAILWIALWAGFVLAVNKLAGRAVASFISLATFYSLFIGHLLGFSSWFAPLCAISIPSVSSLVVRVPAIILLGAAMALVHSRIGKKG